MNDYYAELKKFKKELETYVRAIFSESKDELHLYLEGYNLLEDERNVIQSSTAIGYIIEEYLVSQLAKKTALFLLPNQYKIERNDISTTNASYDCWSLLNNDIKALINIKVCKIDGENNAIASINQLNEDYTETEPDRKKCFMVLKIYYDYQDSEKEKSKIIKKKDLEIFFLEEISFITNDRLDYSIDGRSWSKESSEPTARLMISDSFRKKHILNEPNISYENTYGIINAIFEKERKEKEKRIGERKKRRLAKKRK